MTRCRWVGLWAWVEMETWVGHRRTITKERWSRHYRRMRAFYTKQAKRTIIRPFGGSIYGVEVLRSSQISGSTSAECRSPHESGSSPG